jgi:outer membrane protein, adhesin transport system
LFDDFAAIREVDRQKARVRSSAKRIRETSELIALDAIEAYLESLRQRELVSLSSNNVRIHKNHLKLTRSKVAGGASSQADVEQADSRLASARDKLAEAEGRLVDADSTYNRIVGEEPKSLVRPAAPVSQLPQSLDSVVGLATDMNPTVRVLRADVDTAEEALKGADSPFYPRLDLQLATNRTGNVGGTRGGDIDGSALVVMTYNVFRGGRDLARKRELTARLAESRQRLNRQLRLAEEESRLSWNALQNARLRLRAIRSEVQANDRVRNTYRQQFDIGQRSLLDLLDSENELFIAKTNQITSEFVEFFGIYRILATAGLLLTSLDVAPANDSYMGGDGAGPMNEGAAPMMRQPAGHAPQTNQPLLNTPQAPYDQPIKPTYVPPQQRIAPMGRPVAPRAAPVVRGAPPAGVGAPVLDPSAPVLDPSAPVLDPNAPVAPIYYVAERHLFGICPNAYECW